MLPFTPDAAVKSTILWCFFYLGGDWNAWVDWRLLMPLI